MDFIYLIFLETIKIVTRKESLKDANTQRLLKLILKKISDKTEFLVEEKLFDLLKPYTEEQKTLVCLDNVFNALGIQKVGDINSLKEFFIPYAVCRDCTDSDRGTGTELESITEEEQEDSIGIFSSIFEFDLIY